MITNTLDKHDILVNNLKQVLDLVQKSTDESISNAYKKLYNNQGIIDLFIDILSDLKHPNYYCSTHTKKHEAIYNHKPLIVCEDCYKEAIQANISGTETEDQFNYYTDKIMG